MQAAASYHGNEKANDAVHHILQHDIRHSVEHTQTPPHCVQRCTTLQSSDMLTVFDKARSNMTSNRSEHCCEQLHDTTS